MSPASGDIAASPFACRSIQSLIIFHMRSEDLWRRNGEWQSSQNKQSPGVATGPDALDVPLVPRHVQGPIGPDDHSAVAYSCFASLTMAVHVF